MGQIGHLEFLLGELPLRLHPACLRNNRSWRVLMMWLGATWRSSDLGSGLTWEPVRTANSSSLCPTWIRISADGARKRVIRLLNLFGLENRLWN